MLMLQRRLFSRCRHAKRHKAPIDASAPVMPLMPAASAVYRRLRHAAHASRRYAMSVALRYADAPAVMPPPAAASQPFKTLRRSAADACRQMICVDEASPMPQRRRALSLPLRRRWFRFLPDISLFHYRRRITLMSFLRL